MHNWIEIIDQNTSQFVGVLNNVSEESFNWKPNPNTWSISQNLEHLIVINKSYFDTFEKIRRGSHQKPLMGKLPFIASFLGKAILKASLPDRNKKIKTFDIWEPMNHQSSANMLQQFVTHQEDLKNEITSLKSFIPQGIVISSPANKNIVYNLETALDIITMHEQRHLEQIKELLSLHKENTPSA